MTTSVDLLRSLTRDEFCALCFYEIPLQRSFDTLNPTCLNFDATTNLQFAAYRNRYFREIPQSERSDLSKLAYNLWKKSHETLSEEEQTIMSHLKFFILLTLLFSAGCSSSALLEDGGLIIRAIE